MIEKSIFALPGVRSTLLFLVLLDIVQALVMVGQAWSLSAAIVNLWSGDGLAGQLWWVVLFLACFIGRQALVCLQEARLEDYAAARVVELRKSLLEKVFMGGVRVVRERGTGAVSTLVLEGIDQVETYIRIILPKIVAVTVVPLILLVAIAVLDWVSGIIVLIAFPSIILFMVLLGHTAQDEAARKHERFQMLSNHFVDSLRGIDTLKLFGRARAHGRDIFEVSERFREAAMKTLRVATLSSAVLDLFATGSLAAVAIMLGFRLVDGSLAFFPALVVLMLVPEYFKPVRDFAGDYHASLDGKNALVSMNRLLADAEAPSAPVPLPAWGEGSELEVCRVGYSYADAAALDEVSFRAKGFQNVGIVGASGAGKSTLVSLLAGFANPSDGDMAVAGDRMDGLRQQDWQRQTVFIPQNPYLFHATLRDNIVFYHPDADDADLAEAVRVVGLDDLVSELPDGLDTVVGEGARALSGGQAQRIALARALLDDSRRILLFDEPTAHLDIETELELKERMLPLMKDRLVFFATHRLHWMHDMDMILVMDEGRLVESGTLDELISRNGAFCRLAARLGGETA